MSRAYDRWIASSRCPPSSLTSSFRERGQQLTPNLTCFHRWSPFIMKTPSLTLSSLLALFIWACKPRWIHQSWCLAAQRILSSWIRSACWMLYSRVMFSRLYKSLGWYRQTVCDFRIVIFYCMPLWRCGVLRGSKLFWLFNLNSRGLNYRQRVALVFVKRWDL